MSSYGHSARQLGKIFCVSLTFFAIPVAVSFAAEDAKFAFLAPPKQDMLRLYWLNKSTGQVGACHYETSKDKKQIGKTDCKPSGQGAGAIGSGRYDLKTSNHKTEGSVFRVNIDTGDISICWVRNDKVVCTDPAR